MTEDGKTPYSTAEGAVFYPPMGILSQRIALPRPWREKDGKKIPNKFLQQFCIDDIFLSENSKGKFRMIPVFLSDIQYPILSEITVAEEIARYQHPIELMTRYNCNIINSFGWFRLNVHIKVVCDY